jgi:hypothetical protein
VEAAAASDRQADQSDEEARRHAAVLQAALDEDWEALLRNEDSAVIRSLKRAFADMPFTPLGYASTAEGALVLVAFPDLEVVPAVEPVVTPTGKPSVRKRPKTEKNRLYVDALSSITIAAARQGLAATPGGVEAIAVALRPYAGRDGWEPVASKT